MSYRARAVIRLKERRRFSWSWAERSAANLWPGGAEQVISLIRAKNPPHVAKEAERRLRSAMGRQVGRDDSLIANRPKG